MRQPETRTYPVHCATLSYEKASQAQRPQVTAEEESLGWSQGFC